MSGTVQKVSMRKYLILLKSLRIILNATKGAGCFKSAGKCFFPTFGVKLGGQILNFFLQLDVNGVQPIFSDRAVS